MLILFFVEGLILLAVAIAFQFPEIQALKNQMSYKRVESIFIVLMIMIVLLNVYISNTIMDAWKFPNVIAPYNTGLWTTIVLGVIYLYCFREFDLGGILVTKEKKWTCLSDKEILKLYGLFIDEVSSFNTYTDADLILFHDEICGSISAYGDVAFSRFQNDNISYKYSYNTIDYYTNNIEVANLIDNVDKVIRLKKGV